LPVRGAPTSARWPAPPEKSSISGSLACSWGRSTIPTGTRSQPAATLSSRSSGISGSSGGSQTWCTGRPAPRTAATTASRSVAPRPAGNGAAAGSGAGDGGTGAGRVGVNGTTDGPSPAGRDSGVRRPAPTRAVPKRVGTSASTFRKAPPGAAGRW
jgi:hypothetical protein